MLRLFCTLSFTHKVADLATRSQTVDFLLNANTLKLLKQLLKLLKDDLPSAQQAAAMALARIASFSPEAAQRIVTDGAVEEKFLKCE